MATLAVFPASCANVLDAYDRGGLYRDARPALASELSGRMRVEIRREESRRLVAP